MWNRWGMGTEGELMPGARLELAQCCHRWILSPLRLPIPPSRRKEIRQTFFYRRGALPVNMTLWQAQWDS